MEEGKQQARDRGGPGQERVSGPERHSAQRSPHHHHHHHLGSRLLRPSFIDPCVHSDSLLSFEPPWSMSTPANEPTRDLENGIDTPVRQQRSSVPSLLFLSFVLFMLMNGKGDDIATTRELYVNGLQSLNWQLGNFSAWLNGTESNFTLVSPCFAVRCGLL